MYAIVNEPIQYYLLLMKSKCLTYTEQIKRTTESNQREANKKNRKKNKEWKPRQGTRNATIHKKTLTENLGFGKEKKEIRDTGRWNDQFQWLFLCVNQKFYCRPFYVTPYSNATASRTRESSSKITSQHNRNHNILWMPTFLSCGIYACILWIWMRVNVCGFEFVIVFVYIYGIWMYEQNMNIEH